MKVHPPTKVGIVTWVLALVFAATVASKFGWSALDVVLVAFCVTGFVLSVAEGLK